MVLAATTVIIVVVMTVTVEWVNVYGHESFIDLIWLGESIEI